MSEKSRHLERFALELVNCVGEGPYLEALRRATLHDTGEHFQIDAASEADAEALRAEMRWIRRCSIDAGRPRHAVVITAP